MRTLNYVVLVLVLVSFGFVSFGCGDSDSPTAPSVMQDAPSVRSTAPSTPVQAMPASFDPDGLRHDIRDGFNAYEFSASYDGSMLTLTLTEDEMINMREASKPHRNRTITVEICPSEPKLATLACGDQIWRGSLMLSGTVELDPIPLASCNGWITVTAAELSDDRNDGWRNAPCPRPNGVPVGSDGTGAGWPDYRDTDEYDPGDSRANLPDQDRRRRIQSSVDRVIKDAGGLKPGGRSVQVPYDILFDEPVESHTIRVSTNPPDIVVATVEPVGIDIKPEKPGGLGLPGRAKKIHERVCRYGGHVPIREVWHAGAMTGAVRWGPGLGGTPGTCASNTSNEKRRS